MSRNIWDKTFQPISPVSLSPDESYTGYHSYNNIEQLHQTWNGNRSQRKLWGSLRNYSCLKIQTWSAYQLEQGQRLHSGFWQINPKCFAVAIYSRESNFPDWFLLGFLWSNTAFQNHWPEVTYRQKGEYSRVIFYGIIST